MTYARIGKTLVDISEVVLELCSPLLQRSYSFPLGSCSSCVNLLSQIPQQGIVAPLVGRTISEDSVKLEGLQDLVCGVSIIRHRGKSYGIQRKLGQGLRGKTRLRQPVMALKFYMVLYE